MSHARLVLFNVKPDIERAKMEKVADKIHALHKEQKGFKSISFLCDDTKHEYGGLSIWESAENGEAANNVLLSKLQELIGDIVTAPPVIKAYDTYDSE